MNITLPLSNQSSTLRRHPVPVWPRYSKAWLVGPLCKHLLMPVMIYQQSTDQSRHLRRYLYRAKFDLYFDRVKENEKYMMTGWVRQRKVTVTRMMDYYYLSSSLTQGVPNVYTTRPPSCQQHFRIDCTRVKTVASDLVRSVACLFQSF